MLHVGDRQMTRKNREWVDQYPVTRFEGDPPLFGRQMMRTEEAGTGTDRLRIDLGRRRGDACGIELHLIQGIAVFKQFCPYLIEGAIIAAGQRPLGQLLVKQLVYGLLHHGFRFLFMAIRACNSHVRILSLYKL